MDRPSCSSSTIKCRLCSKYIYIKVWAVPESRLNNLAGRFRPRLKRNCLREHDLPLNRVWLLLQQLSLLRLLGALYAAHHNQTKKQSLHHPAPRLHAEQYSNRRRNSHVHNHGGLSERLARNLRSRRHVP